MLRYTNVRLSLELLDRQYRAEQGSGSSKMLIMYSKLAVLECCGWFEESFDEIAVNCVRSKLRKKCDRKDLEAKIKTTYGFEYKSKFRPLLIYGLGICKVLEIEKEIDRNGDLAVFQGILSNLNAQRQIAAHTTSNGVTQSFPDPSTMLSNYNRTLPIIKKFWQLVK